MCPVGRGVADENIQCAAIFDAVEQQVRQHLECPHVGFCLGVLIYTIRAVADASAKAADQKIFVAVNCQVQIGAAFGTGALILDVVFGVVVAWYVVHWHVQHGDNILQIGVWQVAAPENQINILKVSAGYQRIHAVYHLVAYR